MWTSPTRSVMPGSFRHPRFCMLEGIGCAEPWTPEQARGDGGGATLPRKGEVAPKATEGEDTEQAFRLPPPPSGERQPPPPGGGGLQVPTA